jgi:uncharacterized protein (DUF3820 family)
MWWHLRQLSKKFQNSSDLPISVFRQWREAYFRLSRRKFPAGNTGKLSAMVGLDVNGLSVVSSLNYG